MTRKTKYLRGLKEFGVWDPWISIKSLAKISCRNPSLKVDEEQWKQKSIRHNNWFTLHHVLLKFLQWKRAVRNLAVHLLLKCLFKKEIQTHGGTGLCSQAAEYVNILLK